MHRSLALLLLIALCAGCSHAPAAPLPEPAAPARAPAEPAPVPAPAPPSPEPAPPPQPAPKPPGFFTVETSPTRNGPWWEPDRGLFLPEGHTWLRLQFPWSMRPDPRAEWTDDHTAYLHVDPSLPVIRLDNWEDMQGRPAYSFQQFAYQGRRPVLTRVAPDGKVFPIKGVGNVPELLFLDTARGRVRVQVADLSYWITTSTGEVEIDGSIIVGAHGFGEIEFCTPGCGRVAEVVRAEAGQKATLVISEGGQERLRLPAGCPSTSPPQAPAASATPAEPGALTSRCWPSPP